MFRNMSRLRSIYLIESAAANNTSCIILSCKVTKIIGYVQGSAIISVHVTADMQPVFGGLIVDVEKPVFDREPEISRRLLPFHAQSVAARIRQKVKPLQSHPEIRGVAGTEAVLVISPRQVPVEYAGHVTMHEYDPVEDGNHRNRSLSSNRERYRLVLGFVICHMIESLAAR